MQTRMRPLLEIFPSNTGTNLSYSDFYMEMRKLDTVESFQNFTRNFNKTFLDPIANRSVIYIADGGNAYITRNLSESDEFIYREVPDKNTCKDHLLSNIIRDSYGVEKTDFIEVRYFDNSQFLF